MDEFGETPTYYLWPKGHEEGQPIPEEWYTKLHWLLSEAGIEYETV
jgi:hypothetical protein